MKCPKCGQEALDNLKDCQNCGEPLSESRLVKNSKESPATETESLELEKKLELLENRFLLGEISEKTYQDLKSKLEAKGKQRPVSIKAGDIGMFKGDIDASVKTNVDKRTFVDSHDQVINIGNQSNVFNTYMEKSNDEQGTKLFLAAKSAFKNRDYLTAFNTLKEARLLCPDNDELSLYYCLSALAGKPFGSIPLSSMNEIVSILGSLSNSSSSFISNTSKILLSIVKYEFFIPKKLQIKKLGGDEGILNDDIRALIIHLVISKSTLLKLNIF